MKILYRPEIDGLRAIAVFAVILYHANFTIFGYPLFHGGFIGVDIFFVISGYLITSLILKEIYLTNKFSFKYFYERRIRRILPTLLFVMTMSLIAGYFLLLPHSYVGLAKAVISSIFFTSNFYFHYSGNNYGEENSLLKPLLHTWSLSIEEQFYILFPIFILIIFKFFRKYLFKFIFLGFCISLLFAEYLSKNHPAFAFYQLLPRVFELLLGSMLSFFELNNDKNIKKNNLITNKIYTRFGIILILYSFIFFNFNRISHPGIITLIPIIGLALIIRFSKKGELITEILSSQIFVFFGLISYSLYLWHFPIFAYLRYIDLFNSLQIKLLSIFLVIIISILSYYFIEKPFRNKNITSTKYVFFLVSLNLSILLVSSLYIIKKEGFLGRTAEKFNNYVINRENKIVNYNNENQFNNLILIGDSQAQSIINILNKELKNTNYGLTYFDTIFFIKDFNLVDRKTKKFDPAFKKKNDYIYSFLATRKNYIVVVNFIWTNKIYEKNVLQEVNKKENFQKEENLKRGFFEPINITTTNLNERIKYLKKGIKMTLEDILKNHELIIIYPTPEMPYETSYIINQNIIFGKEINTIISDYDEHKTQNSEIYKILNNIKGQNNVYRIYPEKYFCNTIILNKCIANDKLKFFYRDGVHLSDEGAKYLVEDVMKVIQKIEIDKKN
jgi:peptidoglycan/LPS O-acetylase OafA/YrhL/lysophospholipase L1-like esterase